MTTWSALTTNDLGEFDSLRSDGATLKAEAPGLGSTAYGMYVILDANSAASYGQLDFAIGANVYRIRLYVNPSLLTMATSDKCVICQVLDTGGPNDFLDVELGYDGSSFELTATAYEDGGAGTSTSAYDISTAEHYFEVEIVRADSNVSSDGTAELLIDGVSQETLTGLDNYDTYALIDAVRVGVVEGLDTGTTSTLILDNLEANDSGDPVGPIVISRMIISGAVILSGVVVVG